MTPAVVITGAGAVTPLGHTLAETQGGARARRSAIAPCTAFDASAFEQALAGEVRAFDARPHFRAPKALKLADRTTRLAVAASSMAIADAGIGPAGRDRLGVVVGVSSCDLRPEELSAAVAPDAPGRCVTDMGFFADRVLSGLQPLWLLLMLPNMTSAHVGIQLEAPGPNSTLMTDAAAGLQAIGTAADLIRDRHADAMVAGASDSLLNVFSFAAFQQAGAFADHAFVPAEGAAMLVLEDAGAAQARGARALARLVGYTTRTGARARERAVRAVLEQAGWIADDVTCMGDNADGGLDLASLMGHAGAAAAPIELALALSGAYGSRVLAAAGSGTTPTAAVAIHVLQGARA